MKILVETHSGISYYVDTKKPDEPCLRLFPDLGWVESAYLKNKNFLFNPRSRAVLIHTRHTGIARQAVNLKDAFAVAVVRTR